MPPDSKDSAASSAVPAVGIADFFKHKRGNHDCSPGVATKRAKSPPSADACDADAVRGALRPARGGNARQGGGAQARVTDYFSTASSSWSRQAMVGQTPCGEAQTEDEQSLSQSLTQTPDDDADGCSGDGLDAQCEGAASPRGATPRLVLKELPEAVSWTAAAAVVDWEFGARFLPCPVHGDGPGKLPTEIKALCFTKAMQRLDKLHQLGACSHAFVRATHTRLQHSIGVAFLAQVTLASLRDNLSRLHAALPQTPHEAAQASSRAMAAAAPAGAVPGYLPALAEDRDELCVIMAALAHDAGHGPKSHLFELVVGELFAEAGAAWTHEEMSVRMVPRMLAEHQAAFAGSRLRDLEADDVIFIQECIAGKDVHVVPGAVVAASSSQAAVCAQASWRGRGASKQYLYDIVSNIFSGLDVDKLDYLMRDALTIEHARSADFLRRVQALTGLCRRAQVRWCAAEGADAAEQGEGQGAGAGGGGRWGVCFPRRDVASVSMVFEQRQSMHRQVYNHYSVKPFERAYLRIFRSLDTARVHFRRHGRVESYARVLMCTCWY